MAERSISLPTQIWYANGEIGAPVIYCCAHCRLLSAVSLLHRVVHRDDRDILWGAFWPKIVLMALVRYKKFVHKNRACSTIKNKAALPTKSCNILQKKQNIWKRIKTIRNLIKWSLKDQNKVSRKSTHVFDPDLLRVICRSTRRWQAMQSTKLKTACRTDLFGEPSSMYDSKSRRSDEWVREWSDLLITRDTHTFFITHQ